MGGSAVTLLIMGHLGIRTCCWSLTPATTGHGWPTCWPICRSPCWCGCVRAAFDSRRRPAQPRTLAILIADGISAPAAKMAKTEGIRFIPLNDLNVLTTK